MIWAVNRFMHELPEGVEIVNLVHDEVDAIVTKETLGPNYVETITRAFQETFARFYDDPKDCVARTKKLKVRESKSDEQGTRT